MGISNDWQNINNLTYLSILNSQSGYSSVMDKASVDILASAIGWETVEISNYTPTIYETVNGNQVSIPSSNVWGLRPPADEDGDYNMCFFIGRIYTGYTGGFRALILSTGEVVTISSTLGMPTSVLLLRPTSTGCFAIRRSDQTATEFMIDKFYNPKSDKTKWGAIYYSAKFVDFYTGLTYGFTTSYLNTSFTGNATLGQFVALKKASVVASSGAYTAKTLYMSYIDYSIANKTIELDNVFYRGLVTNYWSFYIALA